MTGQRIVVGVDGSGSSRSALAWAVDEARRRDATVEVVHAWSVPSPNPYLPAALDPETFRSGGAAVLQDVIEQGGDGVELAPRLVEGSAVTALLAASEDADLVVVGSHGHGPLARLLLGSVTQRVLQHARCPVVVVRAAPA